MSKGLSIRVTTVESEMEFNVARDTTGEMLFSQVTRAVGLREVWYFGLQYTDSKGYSAWLRTKKKITAQNIPKTSPLELHLLVRFYPEDVSEELIQDVTQRFFYLQVKSDILNGVIYCPAETCVLLASFACQVKYGDFRDELIEDPQKGLYEKNLLPQKVIDQHELSREQWVEKIIQWYREHSGMLHEEAIMEYLKIAQDLEMYGINYFSITNRKGTQLNLGVDALGLNIYQPDDKLTPKIGFPWSEIKKVEYQRKKFLIASTDKQSSMFVFYGPSRVNRQILALSVSNHDLYNKRRRAASMEIQQMKAQAEEEKMRKAKLRDQMNNERMAREEIERRLAEMQTKLNETSEHNTRIQEQLEEYKRKINELDALLAASDKQKEELQAMQIKLQENNRELEAARDNVTGDFERLMEENKKIQEEIQVKNQEVDESSAELHERKEELEKLREEREELERKAELLEQQNLLKEASMDDNDKDFAQDLDILENGDDRREESRITAVAANQNLQAQLKSLAADLEQKRTETDHMDKLHIENQRKGRDKFQTLRQIRQGNTKKRIDQFEAI